MSLPARAQQQLSVGTLGAVLLKKEHSIAKILTNNVGVLSVLVILGWVVRTYTMFCCTSSCVLFGSGNPLRMSSLVLLLAY